MGVEWRAGSAEHVRDILRLYRSPGNISDSREFRKAILQLEEMLQGIMKERALSINPDTDPEE